MSGDDDKDQRTEDPTPKRRQEMRKEGRVAKSQMLVGWVTLLASVWMVPGVVSAVGERLRLAMRSIAEIAADPTPGRMADLSGAILTEGFTALIPALVGAMVLAILGTVAQQGLVLTGGQLKPKVERINPFKGIRNLMSPRSLWETVKQLGMLVLIVAVSVPGVRRMADTTLATHWSLDAAMPQLTADTLSLVRTIAFAGTVVGLADYVWQRRTHLRDMRMTKEEVKREARESEGDPHIKSKRRSIQASMSRNRMLAAVGDADVVLLNPTHVAVALVYDPTQGAPRVVARGADALAARIRDRARDASVPMVEAPPLARALYRSCRVDDEIPRELFEAVAAVLVFVQRLAQRPLLLRDGVAPLEVADTWTAEGEDPETSLARTSLIRRRRLMRDVPAPIGS